MATHNPNQPAAGESYNGRDNQFQQGAFKKGIDDDQLIKDTLKTLGDEEQEQGTSVDPERNPGDAYTKQFTQGGIYSEEEKNEEKS